VLHFTEGKKRRRRMKKGKGFPWKFNNLGRRKGTFLVLTSIHYKEGKDYRGTPSIPEDSKKRKGGVNRRSEMTKPKEEKKGKLSCVL